MTLTAVVVDDEPLARRRLVRLLEGEPEVDVVAVCPNGREAVKAVREHRPGLLFLDVQMPELDGFGVLRELEAEGLPQVVFVTAYDRYAIKAFEVHALDYLLKPYTPERLKAALRRALDGAAASGDGSRRVIELLESLRGAQREAAARAPGTASAYLTRFLVKDGERMFFVPVDRVQWLEAEGNYVRLHAGTERHLVRATLNGMEEQLDPARFTRIHRSTIVNLEQVKEIRPWFAGDYLVRLHDGTELRLSRRYRDRLL